MRGKTLALWCPARRRQRSVCQLPSSPPLFLWQRAGGDPNQGWRGGVQRPISTLMKSPCIKICQIDQRSHLCLGCYRTLDEIATWSRLSDRERDAIMADMEPRRLAHESQQTKASL
ncbi:DUF1289 domain-containing protein [Roseibium algae]|uniref:DUF1289 domain-containing protein n=1 Tax=Roseibium algae TaxID=3123038 RepID=A0ABU8TIV7_9HYPH